MTDEDILEAIGELDDDLIFKAEARRPAAYYVKRSLGIGAACAAIFAAIVIIVPIVFFTFFFRASSSDPSYTGTGAETEIGKENLTVYFVKNGKLLQGEVFIERTPEAVFDEWRSLCGISRDVSLEECSFVEKEIEGGQVVSLMQLTLSEPLADQAEGADGEMLRESLEQTMRKIFGVDMIGITYEETD